MSTPLYITATVFLNGLGGGSIPATIPMVDTFDHAGSNSFCVITSAGPAGAFAPGLYAQVVDPLTGLTIWKMALTQAALTAALTTDSIIQIVLNASGSTTYSAPSIVYLNGQVLPSGVVAALAGSVYAITTATNLLYGVYTFATLPSAVTAGVGASAFITDANSTTFNAAAAGGGANKVPVFSDGAIWKIG